MKVVNRGVYALLLVLLLLSGCASPTPWDATPKRDSSNVLRVTIKPVPSFPIRFSLGTWQLWNTNSQVEEQRMPIFFSFLPKVKPGVSFSTISALAPREPLAGFVMAITE